MIIIFKIKKIEDHSNQSITLRKNKLDIFIKIENFVDSFSSEFIDNISLSQNGKNVFLT